MSQPMDPAEPSDRPARRDAPLGTLIYRAGLLPADQLEDALEEAERRGRRLGEVLLAQGLIRESDLARLLADQRGCRFVSSAELEPDADAARLLTADKALAHRALPLSVEGGIPVVAITDPADDDLQHTLTEELGVEPRFVVATGTDLTAALERAYASSFPRPAPSDLGRQGERESSSALPEAENVIEINRQEHERAGSAALPMRETLSGDFSVVVRLTNGEQVEVGQARDQAEAAELARSITRMLAQQEPDSWPQVGDRFLRPAAIVSVDIVRDGETAGS